MCPHHHLGPSEVNRLCPSPLSLGAALDDALERLPADAQSHVVGALASAQMLAALFANATRAYNSK